MKRIIRKRFLTKKEVARDNAIRKQIEQEYPPMIPLKYRLVLEFSVENPSEESIAAIKSLMNSKMQEVADFAIGKQGEQVIYERPSNFPEEKTKTVYLTVNVL